MTMEVCAWVTQRLAGFGDRKALALGDRTLRYAELAERVAGWEQVLEAEALPRGSVVALRGDYSPEAVSLFLALASRGHVAVPLPTTAGAQDALLDLAHAEAFFDFNETGSWSLSRLDRRPPPTLLRDLQARGTAGLIVFSSGTTGEPKAALFDVATLLMRYQRAGSGYRTLLFLALDHMGGINTLLHALSCGGTVVVSQDRHPAAVCRAIERHRVEVLPTTPTFLRMLIMSRLHEAHDLSSLRLVTYGTEPMPPATLAHLARVLPGVRFKQTYGLTELGVLPTRSRDSGSLWLQLGGVGCETRIVDGALWIRSETAMLGYLNAPSPFDADGWYPTGDLVEVDGDYVRILGRSSDLINVGGEKVYPVEVETVLLEMDNIREATVWGHPSPVTGHLVAARVSLDAPEDLQSVERRINRYCRNRLAPYKIPLLVELAEGQQHGARFKKLRPTAGASAEPHS